MSIFQSVGLISFTIILGGYGLLYMVKLTDGYVDTILLGVRHGTSVSTEHRWMTVYQQWLPMVANGMVFASLMTGICFVIAKTSDHDIVRILGFAGASWAGVIAVSQLVMCVSGWFYFAKVLRGDHPPKS
ncbi:MAG: hypothetical protein AAF500_20860 [Myxococcota bacterium]